MTDRTATFTYPGPAYDAALRRPLADLVQATIETACHSAPTRRAYQQAIGAFITLLERERAGALGGRLLALRYTVGQHTRYVYRDTPAGVLRLVDADLLDRFSRLEPQGVPAVRTFLAVALREGALTTDQGQALGLSPYRVRRERIQTVNGRRLRPDEVGALRP